MSLVRTLDWDLPAFQRNKPAEWLVVTESVKVFAQRDTFRLVDDTRRLFCYLD